LKLTPVDPILCRMNLQSLLILYLSLFISFFPTCIEEEKEIGKRNKGSLDGKKSTSLL
jgi:hypothetical protein